MEISQKFAANFRKISQKNRTHDFLGMVIGRDSLHFMFLVTKHASQRPLSSLICCSVSRTCAAGCTPGGFFGALLLIRSANSAAVGKQ